MSAYTRTVGYLKTNPQWGHTAGALAMMAVVSDITYLLGGQPAYATGYAFTMAWYYSRALQEHTDQDVQIPGWRNYVVLYWDAWRSSKFVFAFAPATIVLLLCIYGGAVT